MSTPSHAQEDEARAASAFHAMDFGSRREVEAYLDLLNRESPGAMRQIARWGAPGEDSLRVRAVPMPDRFSDIGIFLGESTTTFALDIEARRDAPASSSYSIGIVLNGSMRIQASDGEHLVEAGQGVVINPCEIERTWLEAGTNLVEFAVPKAPMLSLGAEWAPGSLTGLPRFEPLLNADLPQRLLNMAREAARVLPAQGSSTRGDGLFRRWLELISLTLLHEQPIRNAVQARVQNVDPPPAAVRRALDYIEAHASEDIMLADIASAANVSVSSLGRLFNRHIGQSPAALLRDLRLDRIRNELQRGTPVSIRELALRWGFQSPSQFSQAYQRRFGEKPSAARSRG